nr:hypothetical protein Iba_chr11dCG11470 [Ipomoea batatas]
MIVAAPPGMDNPLEEGCDSLSGDSLDNGFNKAKLFDPILVASYVEDDAFGTRTSLVRATKSSKHKSKKKILVEEDECSGELTVYMEKWWSDDWSFLCSVPWPEVYKNAGGVLGGCHALGFWLQMLRLFRLADDYEQASWPFVCRRKSFRAQGRGKWTRRDQMRDGNISRWNHAVVTYRNTRRNTIYGGLGHDSRNCVENKIDEED